MKNLRKINKYIPFFKAGIKTFLVYKAQTFMWLFISVVEIFFVFFLYQAIYKNNVDGMNAVINGFTFYEILLYASSSFVFGFALSDDVSERIYQDVKEGTVVNSLTKPVSYRLRQLFTSLGGSIIQFVFVAIPLLTVLYTVFIVLGFVEYTIGEFLLNLLFFFIFYFISLFVNNSIMYLIGILCFFTEHIFGLNLLVSAFRSFLAGSVVPFAFMGAIGKILPYNPFAFLSSTPIQVLMNRVSIGNTLIYIGIGVAWILFFELINKLIFSYCMRRLVVQGG